MKSFIFLLLVVVLSFSCTKKQGMTSSKIKIFGSDAFSSNSFLKTKANNGMIFYGFNSDGKSFLQVLDSTSSDLTLPNGTWSFYAVSWEQASPVSKFQGVNSCGKQVGVKLSGTDLSLNITISNASCNDPEFSSGVSTYTGNYTLPYLALTSCRNLSGVVDKNSTCSRSAGDLNTNRGFATYVKILIPQYVNYDGVPKASGDSLESGCLEIDASGAEANTVTTLNAAGTVLASNLSFPDQNLGLKYEVRLFFSKEACVTSTGFVDIAIGDNSSLKSRVYVAAPVVSVKTKTRLFVLNDEGVVCRDNRLTTDQVFAGGRGSFFSPYQICTTDQFNLINSKYADGIYNVQNSSLELLADLDFNYGLFNPVGGTMDTDRRVYGGVPGAKVLAEGNGHKISNVLIKCTEYGYAGIFRGVQYANIQNLNLEKVIVDCKGSDYVGALVGDFQNGNLRNIKVSAHVSGSEEVGGLSGYVANSNIDLIATNGIVKASGLFSGGVFGELVISSDVSTSQTLKRTTFEGVVKNSQGDVGGIAGNLSCAISSCVGAEKLVVNASLETGVGSAGGLFGILSNSGSATVSNSYFEGTISGMEQTNSGYIGGLFGIVQIPINLMNVFVMAQKHLTVPGVNMGGVFGNESTAGITNCISNVFFFQDNASTSVTGTCNDSSVRAKDYEGLVTVTTSMANANYSIWSSSDGGLPRVTEVSWFGEGVCDSHYKVETMIGSGSSNNPYIICSPLQFLTISPNQYYVIKKNIFLNNTTSMISKLPGVYYINGENHLVSGVKLIPNNSGGTGFFSKLSFGSLVQNINFFAPTLAVSGSFTTEIAMGLVAGFNYGTLKNISVSKGSFDLSGGFSSTLNTGTENSYGGFVGVNGSTGLISSAKFNSKVNLNFSSANTNVANPYLEVLQEEMTGALKM